MISNIIKNAAKTKKLIVVIRTNSSGSVLTVNAPADTVHHYDYLDELTVTAVADASYHEHGTVKGKAVISQGHFEVEQGAVVPEVAVENVPAGKTAKVTAKEETLISVDTASADKASVVVESSNVYVTGVSSDKISGSQASNVELPTVVSDEEQLAAAITAKKAFIQLGANFTAENAYTINDKTLIDFAGYKITATKIGTTQEQYVDAIMAQTEGFVFDNKPFITNNSSLTINDTKGNGGITSSNNIVISNNSSLTFNSGSLSSTIQLHKFYSGRGAYNTKNDPSTWDLTDAQNEYRKALNETVLRGVLHNASTGKLTFNDGTIETKSDYGFLNYGDAVFNGGRIVSHADNANGGYGYAFSQKDGNITVNYVHITGVHGGFGFNGGKATVNDALVDFAASGNKFYALYIAGEVGYPEVIINGGTFNKGGSYVMYVGNKNDGGAGLLAMANVYGGIFNGGIYVTLNSANNYGIGMLKVYGGQFGINPENISGHSVVADGYKARNNGNNTWTVIPE